MKELPKRSSLSVTVEFFVFVFRFAEDMRLGGWGGGEKLKELPERSSLVAIMSLNVELLFFC